MTTQKFKYTGPALVSHINTRKTGGPNDDERALAIDLKLEINVPAAAIASFEPALHSALWLDGGAVRCKAIEPIGFAHELEGYRMEVAGASHHGVRVKKFRLEPLDNYRLRIVFGASFEPLGRELSILAECLQEETTITLEPSTEDMFEEGAK